MIFILSVIGGIVLATPLGPVNLICIDRALARGALAGIIAGLGAVVGDLIYASVAAFGVRFVLGFVSENTYGIEVFGGLLLIGFGVSASLSNPHIERKEGSGSGAHVAAVSAFVLTITNPAALFGLIAFFGTLSQLVGAGEVKENAYFAIAGVCVGSFLWWTFLSSLVSRFRHHITDKWLKRIATGSGVVLMAFGAVVAVRGLLGLFGGL